MVSNCRPVSGLPICSKISEKLVFNELFAFWMLYDRQRTIKSLSLVCPTVCLPLHMPVSH